MQILDRASVAAVGLAAAAASLTAGCSGSSTASTTSSSQPPVTTSVATPPASSPQFDTSVPTTSANACESTPVEDTGLGPEIHALSTDASVYGLLFPIHPTLRAGDQLKIVWRMTGSGNLVVTSTSPTNRAGVLTFGPELHDGSSYTRPGSEWGTGFLFDEPGCWRIHLQRDVGSGDAWISVDPAS